MDEYIWIEDVIEWFMPYAHAGESIDADVVISDIKGMKAADVAPVTRCENCKYSHADEHGRTCEGYWFELSEYAVSVKDDAFCSYGERRADDATD